MYFRYGQGDPRLPTAVLSAVAGHVLHPVAAVAPVRALSALAEIAGNFAFAVTLDEPHTWQGQEGPRPGTSVPSSAPRGSCPPLPRR